MKALHVRLLKKLEAGKGGMTLERHDLDLLAELGVIETIVQHGIRSYNQCRKQSAQNRPTQEASIRSTKDRTEPTSTSSGMIEQPDVTGELARALATLPKPSKPSTGNSSDKKPAPRADRHTSGQAA